MTFSRVDINGKIKNLIFVNLLTRFKSFYCSLNAIRRVENVY